MLHLKSTAVDCASYFLLSLFTVMSILHHGFLKISTGLGYSDEEVSAGKILAFGYICGQGTMTSVRYKPDPYKALFIQGLLWTPKTLF